MRYRVLLGFAALFTLLVSACPASEKALATKRVIIRELTAKEKKILSQLEEIARKIEQKNAEIETLDEEIAKRQLLIRQISREIAKKEKKLAEFEALFRQRIKHLATTGKLGWINLILAPQDISTFFRRQEYAYLILYHDKQLAQKIREEKETLQQKKMRLKREKTRLEELRQRYQEEREILETLKKEKMALLEEVRRNKRLYTETLRMLENAYAAISQMAEELKRTREELEVTKREILKAQEEKKQHSLKPPPLLEVKGMLLPPIEGEVVGFFGLETDPLTGEKIFHPGITIAAPAGTPVKAPYAGEIVKISIVQGRGTFLFIDHGYHFLSIIGGLGKVTKDLGASVSTGEIIGEVGENPFGRGGVYYELRYKGKPQNPLDWLDTSKLKFLR